MLAVFETFDCRPWQYNIHVHGTQPPLPSPLPPLGRRGNKGIEGSPQFPSPTAPQSSLLSGDCFVYLPKVEELERGAHMLHSTSNLAVLKGTWSSGTLGTDEKTLCPLRLCGESSTFPQ